MHFISHVQRVPRKWFSINREIALPSTINGGAWFLCQNGTADHTSAHGLSQHFSIGWIWAGRPGRIGSNLAPQKNEKMVFYCFSFAFLIWLTGSIHLTNRSMYALFRLFSVRRLNWLKCAAILRCIHVFSVGCCLARLFVIVDDGHRRHTHTLTLARLEYASIKFFLNFSTTFRMHAWCSCRCCKAARLPGLLRCYHWIVMHNWQVSASAIHVVRQTVAVVAYVDCVCCECVVCTLFIALNVLDRSNNMCGFSQNKRFPYRVRALTSFLCK